MLVVGMILKKRGNDEDKMIKYVKYNRRKQ